MNLLKISLVFIMSLVLFFGYSSLVFAGTSFSCDSQPAPDSYCNSQGCTGHKDITGPVPNAGCQCTGCNTACYNQCRPQKYTWSDIDGCSCGGCSKDNDCSGPCPSGQAMTCTNNQCLCQTVNDCPQPQPTDIASCNDYCRCQGSPSGKWIPDPGTCQCDETTNPPDNTSGGTVTIGPPYGGTGPQSIGELIGNITSWVLGIAGAITVLFIILAGLRYITSHGDTKQAEAAKTTLRNAIVGLVIVVISFFLVRLVVSILTGQA